MGRYSCIVTSLLSTFIRRSLQQTCPVPRASDPFSLPSQVTLDRVRRCRNNSPWPCNSVLTKSDYAALDNALSNARAKKLYLAQVNSPARSQTKNVALFISGQYFNAASGGASGGLTGQQSSFRMERKEGSASRPLRFDSYARRLMQRRFFSSSDTFVGLVFDARFHYEYSRSTKDEIVAGYVKYIESKFVGPETIETIYLAGHSRGGCLSMRLAQTLTIKYPQARVIVQAFDPVCGDGDFIIGGREMGVHRDSRTFNPMRDDSYVYHSNLMAQYSRRSCLSIINFLSGAQVPGTLNLVHAFGHDSFTDTEEVQTLTTSGGRPWYSQLWSVEDHDSIDNDVAIWNSGLEHFENSMANMGCLCGTPPPPPPPPPPTAPAPTPCHRRLQRDILIDDCNGFPFPLPVASPVSSPVAAPTTPTFPTPFDQFHPHRRQLRRENNGPLE